MGEKQKSRKAAKRRPPKEIDEPDMRELLAVLFESKADYNVAGWLSVPWRDGWNAARLALNIALGSSEFSRIAPMHNIVDLMWVEGTRNARAYAELEELLREIRWSAATPALRAAMRCMQVVIANSDGGGHVENAILDGVVFGEHEQLMLDARRVDAVGHDISPVGERRRQAFITAWRKGLYKVAYAIPNNQLGVPT